ncbi:MAG: hypothetical protein U1E33_03850 [Rhodospirillales bacterium]
MSVTGAQPADRRARQSDRGEGGPLLAMRQEDVRPAELARRMNVDQPSISRLLDPKHASRPAPFDAAFATLGKRLVLSLENAA